MHNVLGDGTNEDEDEIINDSVGMEDAAKSDNGDGGVMDDIDLGQDGDARQFPPNIQLRGGAINSDEESIEDIAENMEMEVEMVEEADFEEENDPFKRAEKCP